jgi:hypothetical protein
MQTTELVAGRELDALVAERVMGFRWVPTTSNSEQRLLAPPEMTNEAVDQAIGLGHSVTELAPRYSSDMGAAWQVVEFMRGQGLRPVLMPDWGKQWQCVVYRQDQYVCQSKWFDSAPLAICRVALVAINH